MSEQATDPRDLPGADPETGNREIDPVTGYDTTGHDWNGIRELNTPFPRIAKWALGLTFIYSVIAWVLLPAWPVGSTYTKGLLGLDQGEVAISKFQEIDARRTDWMSRFAEADFAALRGDEELLARAMPAAERLFLDNCAACHSASATGGPGYPSLVDGDWLWDGTPEGIAETVRVGINSTHPETNFGQMLAYGADGMLPRSDLEAVAEYVVALPSGTADHESHGALVFEENCAACHGDRGQGGLGIGAPSLADDEVIYGQDYQTVWQTLWRGRQGVMPHWEERLSDAEINLLALYLTEIGAGAGEGE